MPRKRIKQKASPDKHRLCAETYELFREYVVHHLRGDRNRNLDVQLFGDIPEEALGYSHMTIGVEKVNTADMELYQAVADFRPGSKLEAVDGIQSDDPVYKAFIPWEPNYDPSNSGGNGKRHRSRSSSSSSSKAPDMRYLYLWIFLFMLVMMVSGFTTQRSDWRFIF